MRPAVSTCSTLARWRPSTSTFYHSCRAVEQRRCGRRSPPLNMSSTAGSSWRGGLRATSMMRRFALHRGFERL